MDLIQAVVYGIIQGLTEFLPISSTAHIRIVPSLLNWPDPGAAFTAIIQLGTVAAVIVYFAKDLGKALTAWLKSITGGKYDDAEARLGWAVFVGTLPILVLGFLLEKQIDSVFRSLYIICATLIIFGLLMLVAEKVGTHKRKIKNVAVKDGVWVGLGQCLALVPGVSRSGSTISTALLAGFDRVAAARFSFLLSLPSVAGAGLYKTYKAIKSSGADPTDHIAWTPTIVATVISFIVGYAAIAYFIQFLQKRGIAPFVWYRVALGIVILLLLQTGHLNPESGAEKKKPATARSTAGFQPAPQSAPSNAGFQPVPRSASTTGGFQPAPPVAATHA